MAAAPVQSAPARTIVLSIELPEETYRVYQSQARALGLTTEAAIVARLRSCWSHDDGRSLYFNDERRRELEKLLGRNFPSGGHVVEFLRRANTIKLDGKPVHIKPDLLQKIKYAAGRKPLEDAIEEIVTRALQGYLGG